MYPEYDSNSDIQNRGGFFFFTGILSNTGRGTGKSTTTIVKSSYTYYFTNAVLRDAPYRPKTHSTTTLIIYIIINENKTTVMSVYCLVSVFN